jgi:hypothetical protein
MLHLLLSETMASQICANAAVSLARLRGRIASSQQVKTPAE